MCCTAAAANYVAVNTTDMLVKYCCLSSTVVVWPATVVAYCAGAKLVYSWAVRVQEGYRSAINQPGLAGWAAH